VVASGGRCQRIRARAYGALIRFSSSTSIAEHLTVCQSAPKFGSDSLSMKFAVGVALIWRKNSAPRINNCGLTHWCPAASSW
jgi:hypothetical protein